MRRLVFGKSDPVGMGSPSRIASWISPETCVKTIVNCQPCYPGEIRQTPLAITLDAWSHTSGGCGARLRIRTDPISFRKELIQMPPSWLEDLGNANDIGLVP